MTATVHVCLCESCQEPGHLALFRSPEPVRGGETMTPGVFTYTHAIVLCVACAIRSRFARWTFG